MGVPPAPTPALLITRVGGPPNQDCASLASWCDILELGDVAARGERLTAGGDDGVGRCASGGLVDIAADHPATAAGELGGECCADAAACAGDHRGGLTAALPG